jgi:hypothetical protein
VIEFLENDDTDRLEQLEWVASFKLEGMPIDTVCDLLSLCSWAFVLDIDLKWSYVRIAGNRFEHGGLLLLTRRRRLTGWLLQRGCLLSGLVWVWFWGLGFGDRGN